MRFVQVLISTLLFVSLLQGQDAGTQYIGEAVRQGEGALPVHIESSDTRLASIAQRAFALHGGYKPVASARQSAFVIRLEPASEDSVRLVIGSGQPFQEQLRRTVPGRGVQDACLRALDLAVRATSATDGFFAGRLAFVGKQRGVSEIYRANMLFNEVQALTADRALVTGPDWAPKGDRLLFTTYRQSGFPDVFMLDLRARRTVPIATFKGTNSGGSYSPDGLRIAMALSGTGNSELYVANRRGKNLRRLTTNRSLEAAPDWSPDGRRIVFTSDAPGKPQLYIIPANGGPSQRLSTNISGYCAEPAWNPVDPDEIAFTAAIDGGFQLALYNLSQPGSSTVLTSVSGDAMESAWLNDGRHLVFTQRQNGRTRLMLLDTETQSVRALHQPGFGDASSASFVYP